MQNDYYAEFMTQIMKNLEVRQFKQGQIITQEQDECLEVYFIQNGRYNIGYEINRKRRLRKQFGPSTIIGAFQMCFTKRHEFLIIAQTDIICYVIRRDRWWRVMMDYPDFHRIIR